MKTLIPTVMLSLLFALPAFAAEKTVTLKVPGMTCAACPVTVKTALSRVPGVERIHIDFPQRLTTVRYDDGKTTVAALEKATADAGYPSQRIEETQHE